jgi:hypothetical protein
VDVPNVKSAFATPAGKPTNNTKTEIAKILVAIIFFSFQRLLVLDFCKVEILAVKWVF